MFLSLGLLAIGEDSCRVMRTLKKSCADMCGDTLRGPAISQHHLARHVSDVMEVNPASHLRF